VRDALTQSIVDEFAHSPVEVIGAFVTILIGAAGLLKACSLLWENRSGRVKRQTFRRDPSRYTKTPDLPSYEALSFSYPVQRRYGSEAEVVSKFRTVGKVWLWVSALAFLATCEVIYFLVNKETLLRQNIEAGLGWANNFELVIFSFVAFGEPIFAILCLSAGWGLLASRPWARRFTIFLGCWMLVAFPFGTALGIYTLHALMGETARDAYDSLTS
jgi:hypothetical protein